MQVQICASLHEILKIFIHVLLVIWFKVSCVQSLMRNSLTLSNNKRDASDWLILLSVTALVSKSSSKFILPGPHTSIATTKHKNYGVLQHVLKRPRLVQRKSGVKCFRGHQNIADGSINKACWNIWSLLCVQLFNAFKEQLRRFADYHSLLPASF